MEGAADGDGGSALQEWLAEGGARMGDLLRNPDDRDEPLHAVPLPPARAGDNDADVELAPPMRCCSSRHSVIGMLGPIANQQSLDSATQAA
jgi:hypothetical protein